MVKRRSIRIYFEGGGDTQRSSIPLRQGMQEFLKSFRGLAAKRALNFKVIPCGGRDQAYQDFLTAWRLYADDLVLLLVDSEDPLPSATTAKNPIWHSRLLRDRWTPPPGSTDDHCYLMVNSMEAWLLTDLDALESHYQTFDRAKVPQWPDLEMVDRKTLFATLRLATRNCKPPYEKSHAFQIIATVRPSEVATLTHGKRFITGLTELIKRF